MNSTYKRMIGILAEARINPQGAMFSARTEPVGSFQSRAHRAIQRQGAIAGRLKALLGLSPHGEEEVFHARGHPHSRFRTSSQLEPAMKASAKTGDLVRAYANQNMPPEHREAFLKRFKDSMSAHGNFGIAKGQGEFFRDLEQRQRARYN